MKIGIQAWGTDGDIEPLLAIGVELSERGHQVFIDLLRIKKRDYNFLKKYKNLNARIIEFPEERGQQTILGQ
jgi:UDP-N-acetylglucosamine:LPS N-acetylglucosamine transferase